MAAHEEEALGCLRQPPDAAPAAMLWSHWHHALLALLAIVSASVLQLAQPWITKLAIDRYIATGDLAGLNTLALGSSPCSSRRSRSSTSRRG
jgi:hypothetical protein